MKSQRALASLLDDIEEAAARVSEYTSGVGRENLAANRMVLDAVLRNIEIIGEASNALLKDDRAVAARYPDGLWAAACRMRVKPAHHDHSMDAGLVWDTLRTSIPRTAAVAAKAKADMLASSAARPPTET